MPGPTDDRRRHAPATQRNREPILAVLRRVLPAHGTLLEIAAGSGEHALFFASALPSLAWLPSDADADAVESIAAWRKAEGPPNLGAPLLLDVTSHDWPVATVEAIFNANMIHISPWSACLALLAGAGRHLVHGGVLVLYGPYKIDGVHTAPSNAAFDADLKSRNPDWGVRDLEEVAKVAAREGLYLEETIPMPANNQTLVLRRS
jgi:hypothetical protein